MLVAIRRSKHDSVSTVRPFPFLPDGPGRIAFAVCRRIQNRKRCTEGGLFSLGRVYCGQNLLRQLPACNLIHLHWIVDMVDYATVLPELARRVALVWTFHDMNCFTGGCHYDGHCGRFAAACGLCPQLGSSKENDLSRWAFRAQTKGARENTDESPSHRLSERMDGEESIAQPALPTVRQSHHSIRNRHRSFRTYQSRAGTREAWTAVGREDLAVRRRHRGRPTQRLRLAAPSAGRPPQR